MKLRDQINERYSLIVPDHVAEWDAPSAWERVRTASMEANLARGMTLFDVGAEHGWQSALYGREYVGPENMVLFEPSPDLWPNIRKTWEANRFPSPRACVCAFVGAEPNDVEFPPGVIDESGWPVCSSADDETTVMAYRYLHNPGNASTIPTVTVDDWSARSGVHPDAISIDVEGAEYLVLQGAARVLAEDRPLVWCSLHPDLMERDYDAFPDQIMAFMSEHGYAHRHLGTDHEEHHFWWPHDREVTA